MATLIQDLRYGLRTLSGNPGFAIVALLTLALGIGANTAIFSFVDAVLLKPLPYAEADRIVRVMERPPRFARNSISTMNFIDWQRDNEVFDFIAAQGFWSPTLSGVEEPQQLSGAQASAHLFDIFGVQAALGRTFLPDEDQPGSERVVVMTHALWVNQFGADESIVGRAIQLNGEPHTVVGVLSPESAFDRGLVQMWRPLVFDESNMTRDFHWLLSFARLMEGVSLEQAEAGMVSVGARFAQDYPESN